MLVWPVSPETAWVVCNLEQGDACIMCLCRRRALDIFFFLWIKRRTQTLASSCASLSAHARLRPSLAVGSRQSSRQFGSSLEFLRIPAGHPLFPQPMLCRVFSHPTNWFCAHPKHLASMDAAWGPSEVRRCGIWLLLFGVVLLRN